MSLDERPFIGFLPVPLGTPNGNNGPRQFYPQPGPFTLSAAENWQPPFSQPWVGRTGLTVAVACPPTTPQPLVPLGGPQAGVVMTYPDAGSAPAGVAVVISPPSAAR